MFAQLARLVTHQRLRHWRRAAVVVVFVFVAVITPSGDPFTLLTLATPMVLLYEASIVCGRLLERTANRPAGRTM